MSEYLYRAFFKEFGHDGNARPSVKIHTFPIFYIVAGAARNTQLRVIVQVFLCAHRKLRAVDHRRFLAMFIQLCSAGDSGELAFVLQLLKIPADGSFGDVQFFCNVFQVDDSL